MEKWLVVRGGAVLAGVLVGLGVLHGCGSLAALGFASEKAQDNWCEKTQVKLEKRCDGNASK